MKLVALVLVLLTVPLTAGAQPSLTARPSYDWALSGVLVYSLEIPGSGGAWALTLARQRPESPPGALDYILVICDHEQPITARCAALELFDSIEVRGYVLSQEPYTGQRLSVRKMKLLHHG